MARSRGSQKYLGFPKGLNTETSTLNPAEGTTADELNMDLRLNKLIRTRRLGLENVGTNQSTSGDIIGGYYWEAGAKFVLISLFSDPAPATYDTVTIYFYNSDLTFDEEWTVRVLDGRVVFPNFSEIRNRLVVTFGSRPFVFALQDSGCLDGWYLDLYFRDFKLLDDGLGIAERPITFTDDEHKYNVYNAGWYQNVQLGGGAEKNAATALFDDIGEYPSNADILSVGIGVDSSGTTIFQPQSLETITTGNSEAPRGHYVYNIRDIDRQSKTTSPLSDGIPNATVTQVLDCSVNVSGLGGNLLFSETTPAGVSSDPATGGGGESGGGGGFPDPADPLYWKEL